MPLGDISGPNRVARHLEPEPEPETKAHPHEAPCAGTCGKPVRFPDPPLRAGERVYCAPCAEAKTGTAAPVGADHLRARALPHERVVALVAERFANRFGRAPEPRALAAYRAQMAGWDPRLGNLEALADAVEGWRRAHPKPWVQKTLLQPADDLTALRTIARDLAQKMSQDEMDRGGTTEAR
jgi:hypothetical protein